MCEVGLARVRGAVLDGVSGVPIAVEVHVGAGLPAVGIVGLPGASVNEARWRIRSAVQNSGFAFPGTRVTVSLAPAELPKHGAGLDLPMALAILAADGAIPASRLSTLAVIGELALDGGVHPVRGALALIVGLASGGIQRVVVPSGNADECAVLEGLEVYAVTSLREAVSVLRGEGSPVEAVPAGEARVEDPLDVGDIVGQTHARWALEVAAAGRHHLLMTGTPGVGKTMLATRLPSLLPDLDDPESREVTAIHSVAGIGPAGLVRRPPFQAPHSSASAAAMLGAIRKSGAVPGALTLAHRGVLFLDETPEFSRDVLEGLRQSMESGVIALHRAGWIGALPADVQVVFAANPCPCGYFNDAVDVRCTCGPAKARSYQARLSGPLRSRIDIGVHLTALGIGVASGSCEGSQAIRRRVSDARERAERRLRPFGYRVNAQVPGAVLTRELPITDGAVAALDRLTSRGLRGAHRALRVAWSIADLRHHPAPTREDLDEAVAFHAAAQSVP